MTDAFPKPYVIPAPSWCKGGWSRLVMEKAMTDGFRDCMAGRECRADDIPDKDSEQGYLRGWAWAQSRKSEA